MGTYLELHIHSYCYVYNYSNQGCIKYRGESTLLSMFYCITTSHGDDLEVLLAIYEIFKIKCFNERLNNYARSLGENTYHTLTSGGSLGYVPRLSIVIKLPLEGPIVGFESSPIYLPI